ncbi:MAG TPA: hypothetical protein IAD23_05625 [Candidatus Scubalenecus merdavium]|uniref:Uncharacterized protein n=1 Tax=Candidatus Scybalenecus merdavium TaxID=2840939 RepID=A0A9D1SNZ8_9FIRM|nr:hypothetical protein [Candidatus Scubalenecus merdavium]
MDLGMPTLIGCKTTEECAALCHDLKLQFVELNMNLPQYQPRRTDAAQLRALAQRYGIYYTIHLDENLNPGDFNPYVAEAWRRSATARSTCPSILHWPGSVTPAQWWRSKRPKPCKNR